MKPSIRHPEFHLQKDPEIRELANQVGEFIEYWGFKAIQGRMWCYLHLSREPLSSIDLGRILEISPALVTQSVKVLLQYRVILQAEKGPNGVLRYRANPDVSSVIAGVLEAREKKLLDRIQKSSDRVRQRKRTPRSGFELDPAKIEQLGAWTELARHFLSSGLAILGAHRNPFASPGSFLDSDAP